MTDRLVHEGFLDTTIKATCPKGHVALQQHGAPSNNAAAVQTKLTEELGGPDHRGEMRLGHLIIPALTRSTRAFYAFYRNKL